MEKQPKKRGDGLLDPNHQEENKKKAIEAIKPGIKIAKIDSIARQYITENGFGKNFGHALGHGVGMDVHEKPTISGISEAVLRPGMVFTVEPAIYLPKFGGIRKVFVPPVSVLNA